MKSKESVFETVDEEVEEVEEIKMYKVKINYVEDDSIVVNLSGFSKRIYFDLPFNVLEYLRENKNQYNGKFVKIYYIGNILDPFTVKILPLKSMDVIGDIY